MPSRYIYADNAATTQISEAVLSEMLPYLKEEYGNPSSLYKLGRSAGKALKGARERIAYCIGAEPSEIFFTSCGTEADNWAVKGAAELMGSLGKNHIVTTAAEHPAVLNTCAYLEKKGFSVTYISPDESGLISAEQIEKSLTQNTGLVTVMYANNETGVIMPIPEIGEICRRKGVLFHTDAVQALGNVPINVKEQHIGMMSASGHKLRGPKGTGFLYIDKSIALPPFIHGGGQEKGERSGTENTAGIIGLARAAADACENIPEKTRLLTEKRNRIIDGILGNVKGARLNGHREKRLSGNINFSFEGIESESLVLMLDMKGICASGGSACSSSSDKPSHVLRAMGLSDELASGSLRLTLAEPLSDEDIDYIIEIVSQTVTRLREMSSAK